MGRPHNADIQSFLNDNIENIKRFEVLNSHIEIHMKDGTCVDFMADIDGEMDSSIITR